MRISLTAGWSDDEDIFELPANGLLLVLILLMRYDRYDRDGRQLYREQQGNVLKM